MLSNMSTTKDISNLTGLHIVTVQSLMKTLLAHDVVFVAHYEKDTIGRFNTPVYSLKRG